MNSLYFRLLFPLERDTRWLCEQRLCVFRYAQRDKLLFFLSILTRNTANNSIIIPLRRDVIGLDAFSVHSSHIWRKMFRAPVKHTYRTGHVCFAKFPLILEMMRFMKKIKRKRKIRECREVPMAKIQKWNSDRHAPDTWCECFWWEMLGRNTSLHYENLLIFRFIAELCACYLLAYSRISCDKQWRRRRLAEVSSRLGYNTRANLCRKLLFIYKIYVSQLRPIKKFSTAKIRFG